MKLLYSTIIGLFITNENDTILEHVPFKTPADYHNRASAEKTAEKKFKQLKKASPEQFAAFLRILQDPKYFPLYRSQLIALTKTAVKNSVNQDAFIMQTINNIDELDKTINLLTKRLREWYELYLPELSHKVRDHEVFIRLVLEKNKKQLMAELQVKDTMGAELKSEDLNELLLLAQHIQQARALQEKHLAYLETLMKKYCPNMLELCGTTIAAKLLEMAGSLKRLALFPSSTVQLLGAEKALFRHLTRKARSPKHGIIVTHPIVQSAQRKDRGKAARALADKISMCARLDYFKGAFKALEYKKALEKRFG